MPTPSTIACDSCNETGEIGLDVSCPACGGTGSVCECCGVAPRKGLCDCERCEACGSYDVSDDSEQYVLCAGCTSNRPARVGEAA
jgi:RecJ-like exonuclease